MQYMLLRLCGQILRHLVAGKYLCWYLRPASDFFSIQLLGDLL